MAGLLQHPVLGLHAGKFLLNVVQRGLQLRDLGPVFLRLVEEQVHLQPTQLLPGALILDRLLPLLLQGADPALQLMEDVADTLHVLLGVFQLLFGFGAAHAIAHDAGRLLQRGAAVGGFVG